MNHPQTRLILTAMQNQQVDEEMAEKYPRVVIHIMIEEGKETRAINRRDRQVRTPTRKCPSRNQRTALEAGHNNNDNDDDRKPCFSALPCSLLLAIHPGLSIATMLQGFRSNWLMDTGIDSKAWNMVACTEFSRLQQYSKRKDSRIDSLLIWTTCTPCLCSYNLPGQCTQPCGVSQ